MAVFTLDGMGLVVAMCMVVQTCLVVALVGLICVFWKLNNYVNQTDLEVDERRRKTNSHLAL